MEKPDPSHGQERRAKKTMARRARSRGMASKAEEQGKINTTGYLIGLKYYL